MRAGFEAFRRQESTLIALNLAVLAALVLVHVSFASVLGTPTRRMFVAVATFFVLQLVELLALQARTSPLSPRVLRLYPRLSVSLKLLGAFVIALVVGFEDSHYAVLMVLPVIAAAFRFSLGGILAAVGAASVLTFLELWIYYQNHPPLRLLEFYEAATLVLVYLVAGLTVGYLAGQLRRDRAQLQHSLDELEQTRHKLLEEAKLAAVGRLSGAIAHEIRNPVAVILSSAELVSRSATKTPGSADMCEVIVEEARRLQTLTTEFLEYAAVRQPQPQRVSLEETLGYVVGLCQGRARERNLKLRWHADEGMEARLDPFQLHRALLNLVHNALDAAPTGGTVELQASPGPGATVVLTVSNGGGPISAEVESRLFEPFFTTRTRGTGLGLPIARSIARAHGGELTLAHNDDERVCFELRLPGALASGSFKPDPS